MNNEKLILDENSSTDISIIENCSTHIYSHLMKVTMVKPISKSWIRTIAEQSRQLAKIHNSSYWKTVTDDDIKMTKIKRDAIYEYNKDHNKNAEQAFQIVSQEFPDIKLFQQWSCLRDYIIKIANQDNNYEMAKYTAEYHV